MKKSKAITIDQVVRRKTLSDIPEWLYQWNKMPDGVEKRTLMLQVCTGKKKKLMPNIYKFLIYKIMLYIDGDFKSGKGDCEYHCSPTCHPGQVDPKKWHYGCTHKAWPTNKYGDFVPFVECKGFIAKCELKGKKFAHYYKRGKSLSLRYAKKKVERLEKEIAEYNERMGICIEK